MKKRFKYIFALLLFLSFSSNVNASSCSVSASSKTVTVGKTVTIYVKGTDLTANISSIKGSNGEKFSISDTWIENSTITAKFTANKVGKTTVSVNLGPGSSNSNGAPVSTKCNSVTITVKEKSTSTNTTTTKKETKSSNNNLKRLEVEGFNLNPSFSPNTTEYTVNASHDVTKIKIHAWTEHEKGDLSGDGEKEVKEGNNTFEVSVKAENGSKKTYKINVVVDSKPINVEIDGKKYTMIKKSSDLPEISLEHEVIKLNIEDQEVEAYRIDSISYVLVGLRDESGNVNLYKFDSFKDDTIPFEYTLYQEFNSNTITIINIEPDENLIPKGYKKEEITVNDKKIIVYKNENQEYYLVYGINTETGKSNFYTFDKEEETLKKYIEKEEEISNDVLKKIFIVFSAIAAILMAIIIALLNQLKKRNWQYNFFFCMIMSVKRGN